MIFSGWYKELKEIKQENEYYTRECWKKQEKIRELNHKVKELEEEIEVLKNEKKSKRKNTRLPKNK